MEGDGTSHTGGPSEDSRKHAIRPGQLDWVTPVENTTELKRWIEKFEFGADIYLSKEVYPDEKKRRTAWMTALLRGCTLGKFKEMEDLLMLLHGNEVKCEAILDELKAYFLPAENKQLEQAANAFHHFKRGDLSLREAVRALSIKALECGRHGYKPDPTTVELAYKALLSPHEKLHFPSYLSQVDVTITDKVKRTAQALEHMASNIDSSGASDSVGADSHPFAGGASSRFKQGKTPKRKGLHKPKEQDRKPAPKTASSSSKGKCARCGYSTCKSLLEGHGKKECPAYGQTCNHCGKEGHFESVCRGKEQGAPAKAHAAVSSASAGDVGF